MDGIWYATREQVMAASDTANTARSRKRIDKAIAGATRSIEEATGRRFYPLLDTRTFDWPTLGLPPTAPSWMLLLDEDEAISVSTVVSGGVTLTDDQWFARPSNAPSRGKPYTNIQINVGEIGSFDSGPITQQDAIAVSGAFGYPGRDVEQAVVLADNGATVDVSSSADIGVGSLLKIDDERLVVTGRSQLDTGVTLTSGVDAKPNLTLIQVSDASTIQEDEVLLADGEKMLVTDVAGNNLLVKRAWDGTVLAPHATVALYAPRRLQVARAALGTTQGSHGASSPVNAWEFAEFINDWCVAESLVTLLREKSSYADVTGGGTTSKLDVRGVAVADIRTRAIAAYARMGRLG